MIGIVGIIAALTVLTFSLVITRVATVALMMTGMSEEAARFQARSADGNGLHHLGDRKGRQPSRSASDRDGADAAAQRRFLLHSHLAAPVVHRQRRREQRERVDRFRMERETLEQYCRFTRRRAIAIHQKDPLLGEEGLVRDGKAEGMIDGMLPAKMAGKDYVGFIDADNCFPGSVREYVRSYAAGLSTTTSPYTMVRILWRYKPKLSTHGFYFKMWGRVSQVTNRVMNALVSVNTGSETDVVKTGNAGEHAMSLQLAKILSYASGFAIEPQELISIFEAYGGVLAAPADGVHRPGVEIVQLDSRNPHLHEEKAHDHLLEMLTAGLGTIFHSALSDGTFRDLVREELDWQAALDPDDEPPQPVMIPPFGTADVDALCEPLSAQPEQVWITSQPDEPTLLT